jgi:hypothetical protein
VTSNTPCLDRYDAIIRRLQAQARNAAKRNKPTMWAYYGRMAERLERELARSVYDARNARGKRDGLELRSIDGGIAGSALALVQRADAQVWELSRDEAADLWALSVYANRILAAWTKAERRSLAWLRARAGIGTLAGKVVRG